MHGSMNSLQLCSCKPGRKRGGLAHPKMEWLREAGTALIVAASDAAGRTSAACKSPSKAGMASACLMASYSTIADEYTYTS